MPMSFDEFKDSLSKDAHGITKAEALKQEICIECKRPNPLERCHTEAGKGEYYISGYCEECFDRLFQDEEPEDDETALRRD